MSKKITKSITKNITIEISEFENIRCSRNCNYCYKENGLYYCFLRDKDGEDIELLDDIDDSNYDSADTYGFKRTDYCIEQFGK